MTTWWHHPTILNLRLDRRLALRISCILLLCIALITTLFFSTISHAAPGVNQTVGFQGRLLDANGDVVPDGHYNMQFKIYQDGTGTVAGNPSGTLKWTETYVNNGSPTGAVEVKNGFMSVNLGSLNPFGTSVDWNQDTLWLSMNVAGSSSSCTTFGTSPCAADGEMLPMKRMTATPFALNSAAVNGKTTDQLVQLGQGAQTDATTGSSIYINKTGAGNLLQLQSSGVDAFLLNTAGSITMGSSANQSITVAPATSGAGKSLTITAGSAASGVAQDGGDLLLQGGASNGVGSTGNVIVKGNGNNTTGTFQVQNTAGSAVLSVDTVNNIVSAGTINLSSTVSGVSPTSSLWPNSTVPATIDSEDNGSLELGMKFRASQTGTVTGVKFYKGAQNTGTHVGNLWNTNGDKLATVVFSGESASGWQQASFASPVRIDANTTYIISYFAPNGRFSKNTSYFSAAAHTSGPLTALQNGIDGANSVYSYTGSTAYPTSPSSSDNYWVDVLFQPDADVIGSSNNLLITSAGAMTVGPTSSALNVQGSTINIGATNGGSVSIQGGNAVASNSNGGNITLGGGAGNGTGANGLVVLNTPTFATATNDANCYTSGAVVASSCTITAASVNNSASVIVGFSTIGQTATLPDPTITTAGRIMYITSANGSKDFTLSMNGGGKGNQIIMRQNTTSTVLWNGSDWTIAGASNYGVNTTDDIQNVQIGSGTDDGTTTLLTVDKAASAPTVTDSALLGSMYYDTTVGKLQCFEADGWGACSSSPDSFVTLSPEYANAVKNGNGIGTMTSDLCSDTLNINDGSSSQPTVCGTNETYNFYNWTTSEVTDQKRSIYVTYQLPTSFKQFVSGSTSLMGRTDSTDSDVSYQVYKNSGAGLTACGAIVPASTGVKTTWQKAIATSTADPSTCGFAAGDSVVFKISLTANSDANAYASNLNFAFSNQ